MPTTDTRDAGDPVYECMDCGDRRSEIDGRLCPDCGGYLTDLGTVRDE